MRRGSPWPTTTPTTAIAWSMPVTGCVYCAEAELTHHEGLSRGFSSDPDELAAYREMHRDRVDRYFSPHFDPEIETFQIKPTVVPIGSPSRPIPMLAVTHNLNWEGAPRIEFELVRRLQAAGVDPRRGLQPGRGSAPPRFRTGGDPDPGGTRARPDRFRHGALSEGVAVLAEWIRERGFEVVHANTLRTFWAVAAARRRSAVGLERARERALADELRSPADRSRRGGALLPGLPVSRRLLRAELHPRVERPQHVREF